MKKQLGKKAHVQEGTMTAFACDCIYVCQSSAFCNCTSAAVSYTHLTSFTHCLFNLLWCDTNAPEVIQPA